MNEEVKNPLTSGRGDFKSLFTASSQGKINQAMALTRETERGTMENLLAMPTSPLEIMLGKVLPYLIVGAVQVIVVLGAAKPLFLRPLRWLNDLVAREYFPVRFITGTA